MSTLQRLLVLIGALMLLLPMPLMIVYLATQGVWLPAAIAGWVVAASILLALGGVR